MIIFNHTAYWTKIPNQGTGFSWRICRAGFLSRAEAQRRGGEKPQLLCVGIGLALAEILGLASRRPRHAPFQASLRNDNGRVAQESSIRGSSLDQFGQRPQRERRRRHVVLAAPEVQDAAGNLRRRREELPEDRPLPVVLPGPLDVAGAHRV